MEYVLVKFKKDYSDEFDVYGFWITEKAKLLEFLEKARKYFVSGARPKVVYFGTNEFLEYECYDDVYDSLFWEDITEQEALRFKSLFGRKYWGTFATPEF